MAEKMLKLYHSSDKRYSNCTSNCNEYLCKVTHHI